MTTAGRPPTANDLPDGWAWTTLEDAIEIKYGKGLPRRARKEGDVKVFGSNGEIGHHNKAFTKGTTLIIGRKGSVGEVHLSDSACWPIDTTYFVDDFPVGLNLQYLFHFLKRQDLAGFDRSTAVPGINRNDLYGVKLPLPPLAEQQRIVAKIEALFQQSCRGREALDAVPDLLAQFRQAVLAAAFRGGLTERDPADEPASVLLERIRAERRRRWEEALRAQGRDPSRHKYEEPAPPDTSDLPELPEGWVWTTLNQVLETLQYGTSVKADATSDVGVPVLRMGNIQDGGLVLDKLKYIHPEKENIEKYRLVKGDILINRTNSPELVGKSALFDRDELFVFASYLIRLRPGSGWALSEYVVHYINSPLGRAHIAKVKHQVAGQANINSGNIRSMPLPLPPLAEQYRIVARVEALFTQADLLEAQVAAVRHRLEHVDQAVLARAFRGELVPQDPDDEPASVLLERIRKEREAQATGERKRQTQQMRFPTT